MDKYLVDLNLNETFTIPDEKERDFRDIATRLAAKIRAGAVIFDGCSPCEGHEIDHHDDGQIPVVCNQTLFEVVLAVPEQIDVYDNAAMLDHVATELEQRSGHVESLFSSEGEDCERTVVRIVLG